MSHAINTAKDFVCFFGIYQPYRMKNRHSVDLSGSNMDGSFTTAVSNLLVGWWFWV